MRQPIFPPAPTSAIFLMVSAGRFCCRAEFYNTILARGVVSGENELHRAKIVSSVCFREVPRLQRPEQIFVTGDDARVDERVALIGPRIIGRRNPMRTGAVICRNP